MEQPKYNLTSSHTNPATHAAMSSEGATPEIAVDIVSIESAAVEGAVQEDVLGQKKLSSEVTETNKSEDEMPETMEINSEQQNLERPATDTDRKEDELDAERQTRDSKTGNVPDSKHPTRTLSSRDPPAGLESSYVIEYSSKLCGAAASGDWQALMLIAKEDPTWLCTGITKGGETVVHIAAAAKHVSVVEELILCYPSFLHYTNKAGSTPFCFAAASGVVEIAKIMHEKNNELPNIRGKQGMTPLHMAVLLGHRAMVWYLLEVTDDRILTNQDHIEILTSCIDTDLLDVALHVLKKNLHLALLRDERGETALHALARKPLKQGGYRPSFWRSLLCSYTSNGHSFSEDALELTQILWNQVIQHKTKDISAFISRPWSLLFVAAQTGKSKFLTTLIQSYPDLIWNTDENGYTIFHTAVIYRQPKVFKLIYEIGDNIDLIAKYKDKNNNNMLHLASKLPPLDRLNRVPGAFIQMQSELHWLEAVEKIVGFESTIAVNGENKTPRALFVEEHESLKKQGEEWMKKSAESYTLVAALIATMVFSAAFQVPGGLNNDTGSPVLVKTKLFGTLAVSNAVSLVSSTASMMLFLSILTSRYTETDFLKSLPKTLTAGLFLLLLSLETMISSFAATISITLKQKFGWPPIIITLLSVFPIILFVKQQKPLMVEMVLRWDTELLQLRDRENIFSPSNFSSFKRRNPQTGLNKIKQYQVDHSLESFLPRKRHMADSDSSTISAQSTDQSEPF